MMKPIIVQKKADDLVIERIWRPKMSARAATIEKRAKREPKAIKSSLWREYWKALAAAMTGVKGNGGGAMHARATAYPAPPLISFFKYSKRLRLIIFSRAGSPPVLKTKSSRKIPEIDPAAAAGTYSQAGTCRRAMRMTSRKSFPKGRNRNDESAMPSKKGPAGPRFRRIWKMVFRGLDPVQACTYAARHARNQCQERLKRKTC
jgi:hypothetical protein